MTTPMPDIPADLRPAYKILVSCLRHDGYVTEDTILAQVSQPTQTPVVRVQDMSGLVLELESFGLISNSGLVWTLTTLGHRWLDEHDTPPEPFVVNPEPIRQAYDARHPSAASNAHLTSPRVEVAPGWYQRGGVFPA